MCDFDKYTAMYKEMCKLEYDDIIQLILEAKSKEEKDFFELVGNYILQQRQKKVIERKLF